MQVHVIHEIDCSVERIDPAVVEAFLDAELSDDPMLADSICAMADAMSAELHPRGVYKLFNPAICTLPPKYTEPAIKLVGTLAVLYGSAAYERMSEAEHTAMVVSTVGTDEEIARLRERLVKSDMDALLFDACLEAMASWLLTSWPRPWPTTPTSAGSTGAAPWRPASRTSPSP